MPLSSSLLLFGPLLAFLIAIGAADFIYFLRQIFWVFALLSVIISGIGTLFFLGYFRFETPQASSGPNITDTTGSVSATTVASSRPHLWLYECQHSNTKDKYFCFPPYCTPGGLRSRLFDSTGEGIEVAGYQVEESEGSYLYRTTNSTNNPLDKILQSPYVPLIIKQKFGEAQHDWNTLGGSQCSCKRNSLAIAKELLEVTNQDICEGNQFSLKQDQKSEGEGETSPSQRFQEGFRLAAQRLVSQAVSAYHSHTSNLNHAETQEPAVVPRSREQGEETQGEHFQQTMTAQQIPLVVDSAAAAASSVIGSAADGIGEIVGDVNDLGVKAVRLSGADRGSATAENANLAGKPIPQAVLIYHESAHSIVFRDHLRRQQSAIRRTSSIAENNSSHGGTSQSPDQRNLGKQYSQPVMSESTSNISRGQSTLSDVPESDEGYESGGSRGSASSARSGNSSGGSSRGSGSSRRRASLRRMKSLPTSLKQKPAPTPTTMHPVVIANFQPVTEPLESLDLDSSHVFQPLLDGYPSEDGALEMTDAESEVVELLKNEQAVVKTIRNADWTAFFENFKPTEEGGRGEHKHHHHAFASTAEKSEVEFPFNSFVTSTSLLPSCAKKMRCFGSTREYAVGVVFALPQAFPSDASEEDAAKRTRTWSWPSGYSAKTEFNIDHRGNLINGREEALVPLNGLRKMNHAYLHDEDYIVGGRMVKGGLTTIPYNEVFIRVGGLGRIACGVDAATGKSCDDADGTGRSFDHGIGLPIAIFTREANYGHLVRLLRTRARYSAIFGSDAAKGIPLLFVAPEYGVRVFTEKLQHQVLKAMASDLNPFQNPLLAHRTSIDSTSEPHLQQKLEELLDLNDDNMKQVLTPEERARIAGGFGATDESVASLLNQAMQRDMLEKKSNGQHVRNESGNLQDLVNEGLAFALRANDYHTSRQLLILYTLVASKRRNSSESNPLLGADEGYQSDTSKASSSSKGQKWRDADKDMNTAGTERQLFRDERAVGKNYVPPPPPPPPLDTDRLRSATNSDGLLAVLGAAQVLRAMQDGSAKRRVKESIDSIEEWIENGEQSVAFRVASWRDQRAAQGDLKIATENDSNFMAFISNKAISNRKKFAQQLRDAAEVTEFDSLQFLKAIHSVCSQMNSPCLRLELLQYILGLDNRYSVAHVTRSVELAATCLNLSDNDLFNEEETQKLLLKQTVDSGK